LVRPLKQDREVIALTTVRVSKKTRAKLDQLKKVKGYKTTEELIQFLLESQSQIQPSGSSDRPTRQDIIRATHENKKVDRIIRGLAARYKK
jgi:hypothetical protein